MRKDGFQLHDSLSIINDTVNYNLTKNPYQFKNFTLHKWLNQAHNFVNVRGTVNNMNLT